MIRVATFRVTVFHLGKAILRSLLAYVIMFRQLMKTYGFTFAKRRGKMKVTKNLHSVMKIQARFAGAPHNAAPIPHIVHLFILSINITFNFGLLVA